VLQRRAQAEVGVPTPRRFSASCRRQHISAERRFFDLASAPACRLNASKARITVEGVRKFSLEPLAALVRCRPRAGVRRAYLRHEVFGQMCRSLAAVLFWEPVFERC
jgi:hypothetical protein